MIREKVEKEDGLGLVEGVVREVVGGRLGDDVMGDLLGMLTPGWVGRKGKRRKARKGREGIMFVGGREWEGEWEGEGGEEGGEEGERGEEGQTGWCVIGGGREGGWSKWVGGKEGVGRCLIVVGIVGVMYALVALVHVIHR